MLVKCLNHPTKGWRKRMLKTTNQKMLELMFLRFTVSPSTSIFAEDSWARRSTSSFPKVINVLGLPTGKGSNMGKNGQTNEKQKRKNVKYIYIISLFLGLMKLVAAAQLWVLKIHQNTLSYCTHTLSLRKHPLFI